MLINRSAIQIYNKNSNDSFEFKGEQFFLAKMLINVSDIQIHKITFLNQFKISSNQKLIKENYGKEPF